VWNRATVRIFMQQSTVKPVQRWAQAGILIQLLIVGRALGECFRLKALRGPELSFASIEPYIAGSIADAVLCGIALIFYFLGRYCTALSLSIFTVIGLLIYKIYAFGWRM